MGFQVVVIFIDSFMDDVTYVRMLKSVWSVRFVEYRGAFAVALRILDWDLCMMTMLNLLA